MEGTKTITFSTDGHIKLWEKHKMLFNLKLPELKKISWNMGDI
jgi:hypothetical protein